MFSNIKSRKNAYSFFLTACFTLALSIFIGMLFFCASFYIRESGRIFLGFITHLLEGKFVMPLVVEYESCCFMPVPQNIRGLPDNWLISLGGPVFVLLLTALITLYFKERFKVRKECLMPLIITIIFYEFIGNGGLIIYFMILSFFLLLVKPIKRLINTKLFIFKK